METADKNKAMLLALIDKVNNTTGESDTDLSSAVDRVVANYGSAGYDEGYAQGVVEGKQAEYDYFWDNLQNYGKRTNLQRFLADTAFEHIDPKYFVKATNADNLMSSAKAVSVNWEKFDLSSVSSLYSAFAHCANLKSVDTDLAVANETATFLNAVFRNCTSLVRVQKITAFPSAVWGGSFDKCAELVDITFDGTIGANGLDMHWSTKLSKASIISIINVLSDETSALTVTLSLDAVKKAFETAPGANDGNVSDEWGELNRLKSNWSIALA